MFRKTILVDETSDPAAIIRKLERAFNEKGNDSSQIVQLADVEKTILNFANSGRQLVKTGSHFNAERTVVGPNYQINIRARFGKKPSLVERLATLIGR